jgi:hypothetical protein
MNTPIPGISFGTGKNTIYSLPFSPIELVLGSPDTGFADFDSFNKAAFTPVHVQAVTLP